MLSVARERDAEGDLFHHDMGQGLPFGTAAFDGAISVSAVQWLCNADKKWHNPMKRLASFFESLYRCLVPGARACLQLYPETPDAMRLITQAAMRAGFSASIAEENAQSKKKRKLYLILVAGNSSSFTLPKTAFVEEDEDMQQETEAEAAPQTIMFAGHDESKKRFARARSGKKRNFKDREWVQRKKEQRRNRGQSTANDSKYTARRRRPKF
ncbi:MAG: hypothetical protein MHM6MM_006577 [Cercozoa sp. M6MM]